MNTAYIIDAIRTPIGRMYGTLSTIRPDDLVVAIIQELLERNAKVDPNAIADLLLGCANQAGEDNRNIARQAVLLAGLPKHIPGGTINRLCASGMESIQLAAKSIWLGEGDVYLAGGVETMSRSPFVESRIDGERVDSTIGWRFVNPKLQEHYQPLQMAETVEFLASKYNISRQEQDKYAHASRLKYQDALEQDFWSKELIKINELQQDEQHRVLKLNTMAKLPSMVKGGQFVTVGNSARGGDGAALVLLASEKYVKENDLKPIAKIRSIALTATHPNDMGIATVESTKLALKRAKLDIEDLDNIELSESFAAQVLASIKELNLNENLVNIDGGGISTGNPTGMGAARLLVTLMNRMQQNKDLQYCLATTGAGLGIGASIIVERC
ncbi:MAG: thiolase family protein [Aureispira sp.]|nr:thiolase family protein [Aureispira sp.]